MKTCISCGESYENRTILTEPYCPKCCTAPWCAECHDVLDFCEHYERETYGHAPANGGTHCVACGWTWPCPTYGEAQRRAMLPA